MGKRIAITGGIGAGKTTVLDFIKELGYTIFSCDEIYKEIINEPLYISKIKDAFPLAVEEEKINRAKLAKIIFSDLNARRRLNAIAHPIIMERLIKKMDEEKNGLVFAEVPLLFEGNFQDEFSEVIVVVRAHENRIAAVSARDGISNVEAFARLSAQYDYEDKKNMATWAKQGIHVLENNQDKKLLKENLIRLIENLK